MAVRYTLYILHGKFEKILIFLPMVIDYVFGYIFFKQLTNKDKAKHYKFMSQQNTGFINFNCLILYSTVEFFYKVNDIVHDIL